MNKPRKRDPRIVLLSCRVGRDDGRIISYKFPDEDPRASIAKSPKAPGGLDNPADQVHE